MAHSFLRSAITSESRDDLTDGPDAPTLGGHQTADISFVMPCFNEERVVIYTITRLLAAFRNAGHRLELVAVDNGSLDNTGALICDLAGKHSGIRPLRVETNEGYGNGVLAGLPLCTAPWIGIIPADGQVDAEDVVRLYEAILVSGGTAVAKVRRRFRMDGLFRKQHQDPHASGLSPSERGLRLSPWSPRGVPGPDALRHGLGPGARPADIAAPGPFVRCLPARSHEVPTRRGCSGLTQPSSFLRSSSSPARPSSFPRWPSSLAWLSSFLRSLSWPAQLSSFPRSFSWPTRPSSSAPCVSLPRQIPSDKRKT